MKKKKERREIEGESEEGEKVRWCEEFGKYGEVFIGRNGSLGCNYHKCGKKKRVKVVKNV